MNRLITAAVMAALGLAILASTSEAGIFRRRDGTARLTPRCHCNR